MDGSHHSRCAYYSPAGLRAGVTGDEIVIGATQQLFGGLEIRDDSYRLDPPSDTPPTHRPEVLAAAGIRRQTQLPTSSVSQDMGERMTATSMTDVEVTAAVTETLLDYAEFVDTCEADRWAELFCADGEFDEGRVVKGREALAVHVRKLLRLFDATAHHISNIRVRRTGDEAATATCYVYAWHRKTDGDDFEIWGRYRDELRVEDGRWRFAKRRVEMFGSRGWDIQLDRAPRRSLD